MRYLLLFVAILGQVLGHAFEDPDVVRGKLDNGLTYLVKKHGNPEEHAFLELVVKVGSIYENEEQKGYAHIVEHMVFRGSENFKDNEAIHYMESLGAWGGEDSNAETSFDSTTYHFAIPLEDPEALRTTVMILSDFAARATFAEELVQKEKGVILDEYHRGHSNADEKANTRKWTEFLPLTPFSTHLPIGTEESIQNVTAEGLKEFYKKWYTPDRMAVIAVGDFEVEQMVGLIKEVFGTIEAPAEKTPEPIFEVKVPDRSKAVIHVDSELTDMELTIGTYVIDKSEWSAQEDVLEEVQLALIKNRLKENASHYIYSVGVDKGFMGLDIVGSEIDVDIRSNPREALLTMERELRKMEKNGFTRSELERVRSQLKKKWGKKLDNVEQVKQAKLGEELEAHFLYQRPMIVAELLLTHHLKAVEDVSIHEINDYYKKSINKTRVIFLSSPEKIEGLDERWLLDLFDENGAVIGEIVKVETEEKQGISTWTLSNGVSVSLKSTKNQRQNVHIQALALGGLSATESPEEYMTACLLTPYVMMSGFGPFSQQDLQILSENEKLFFTALLEHDVRSLVASGHRQDLETMFELFHAFFAAPTFNSAAWSGLKEGMKEVTKQLFNEPAVRFKSYIDQVYSNENYRAQMFDSNFLDESLSQTLYKRFFGSPRVFHFTVVGDFTPQEVEPLVKKYLGSLPDRAPEPLASANIIERPKEMIQREYRFGKMTTTETVIGFVYNVKQLLPHVRDSHVFNVMSYVLQLRLQNVLRKELGHTYHVSVDRYGPKDTSERNDVLQISFTAQDRHRETMIRHTLQAIEEFKTGEISREELSKAQHTLLQALKKSERSNVYWSAMIGTAKIFSVSLPDLLSSEAHISSVTTEDVKKMVQELFGDAHPIILSHLPALEKSKP